MKRIFYIGSVTHHPCMRLTLKLLYLGWCTMNSKLFRESTAFSFWVLAF